MALAPLKSVLAEIVTPFAASVPVPNAALLPSTKFPVLALNVVVPRIGVRLIDRRRTRVGTD